MTIMQDLANISSGGSYHLKPAHGDGPQLTRMLLHPSIHCRIVPDPARESQQLAHGRSPSRLSVIEWLNAELLQSREVVLHGSNSAAANWPSSTLPLQQCLDLPNVVEVVRSLHDDEVMQCLAPTLGVHTVRSRQSRRRYTLEHVDVRGAPRRKCSKRRLRWNAGVVEHLRPQVLVPPL